jgi:hypothetical protein
MTSHRIINSNGRKKSLKRNKAVQLKESKSTNIKVKVKVTLEQATKAPRGSRGIALLFL